MLCNKFLHLLFRHSGDVQIQVIPVEEGSLQEGMQIAASASADMADGMQVLALPQA